MIKTITEWRPSLKPGRPDVRWQEEVEKVLKRINIIGWKKRGEKGIK